MSACDPQLIACQISTVTEAIGSWNWNSFLATAAATAIGGLLGLFGVWVGFRLQRRDRYQESLNDCVAKVLDEIGSHAAVLRVVSREQDFVKEYDRANVPYLDRFPDAAQRLHEPDDLALSMTLEIAKMRARGADQAFLIDALRAHDELRRVADIGLRLQLLGRLGAALADWRAELRPIEDIRRSLQKIVQMAEPVDAEVG